MLSIISRIRENIDISLNTGVSLVFINCILQRRLSSPRLRYISCLLSINVNPIKRKYEWESLIKIDSHTYTRTYTLHMSNVTSHARFVSRANEDVSEEHFPFVLIASHSSRLSSRKTAGSSSRSRRVFP